MFAYKFEFLRSQYHECVFFLIGTLFAQGTFWAIVYATWENLGTKSAMMANIAMDAMSSFLRLSRM